jgi:hypothetical protein
VRLAERCPPDLSFFAQTNFFGNDRNRPVLNVAPGIGPNPAPNPGPSAHCGVLNLGDVAAAELAGLGQGSLDPQTLNAGYSFWGSTHGPALAVTAKGKVVKTTVERSITRIVRVVH